ncbi:NitT/TauT family transport system ATP-binding protein [Rhodovulum sulfidophilum]|nr:hypothetical protein A6W98_07930 [Rhodovulum sulfidophilum DSM 1374]ANB37828.1 hypothetical protein A6024_07785 [Rhodovulum sulfidophilum]MCW2304203.1 NitT/TauT family transport system ATP-binding protein [Rhodovulum sulfidophilum]
MSPDNARKERSYGYVFQAAGLYPWQTIVRNIRLALEIMGYPKVEQAARMLNWSIWWLGQQVYLAALGRHAAAGQHRPALAFDVVIQLMDEPFGALDEIVRDHLNEQLLALWARTGKICDLPRVRTH